MKKAITRVVSSEDNTRNNHNAPKEKGMCCKKESVEEIFCSYKCKYCQYVTAQKWILEKHISSVHDQKCGCKKLRSPCISSDVLKVPYRYKPF